MTLKLQHLRNLPVVTQTGRPLGRVVDLEFDPERQEIAVYHVRSRAVIPGLFERKLFIDRRQVVSLTPEKLIVDDAAAPLADQAVAATDAPPSA